MNVIEKKYPAQDIRPYVSLLQWNKSPIMLLRTGGNASQLFPSDIDLFSKIAGSALLTPPPRGIREMFVAY